MKPAQEIAAVRLFVIEACGGPGRTDGAIKHFTVQANDPEEAVQIVQRSEKGRDFERLEIVDVTPSFEPDVTGIVAEEDGPYPVQG
jgi:hypothetical protein